MEPTKSLTEAQNYLKEKKDDIKPFPKKSKKIKKKERKRKYSSSDRSEDEPSVKRLKGKHKKKCKKRHKHAKDKKYKINKDKPTEKKEKNNEEGTMIGPEIPRELLQKAQSMAPMSKEEWEKRQSTIRRVYDEGTGRTRLIRGEGEIIEEIVSRERHQEINRQATQGDGDFFQSKLKKWIQ